MTRNRMVVGTVLPRPHSFLANSLIFSGGVLFAWLEGYRGIEGTAVPVSIFVLLWFIVQELLVQQAKYMWNDIRDHERDQHILANKVRPLTRQPLTKTTTWIMVGRWLAGLVLAGWLSPILLIVVLMISGLQLVYELWAKPRAGDRPLLPLIVVGAGMVLKGIGGALAMGSPAGEQRMWLYGLALFATGLVVASSFWRAEAVYFAANRLVSPRGQSAYYEKSGLLWLKVGTAVTVIACTLLIFDGYAHWLKGAGSLPLLREPLAPALFLAVLLINHGLNYRVDYKRQNLIYLRENWPSWKRIALERPWSMGVWYLLQLALLLNSSKYKVLRRQQEVRLPTGRYLSAVDSPIRKREVRGEGRMN